MKTTYCKCGEPMDQDCNGYPRCPYCDEPCPCCNDGGMTDEPVEDDDDIDLEGEIEWDSVPDYGTMAEDLLHLEPVDGYFGKTD